MYPIVSTISFIIRFSIAYYTIEQLPIFANESANWVL